MADDKVWLVQMSTASGVYWLGLWLSLLCVAATLTGCGWLWSPNTSDLYSAQNCAFVNGQSEATIAPRIIDCLIDVLVKVSGDPTVADDLKRSAFASSAHDYVTKLTYRDFMEGLPIGDEQGTRDRPFFLTVTFKAARIDALLNALSRKPWMGPRPRI